MEATESNEPKTFDQLAESLLAPSKEEAPNPEPEMEEAADAPDDDQPEAVEADDEVGDDAQAEAGEEAPAEDETTGEEDAPSEQPETRYTVKVDGVEKQVTLDELRRSYSGQSHIQKGMQEAAETRKRATALEQQLTQERQQLAALVQNIQETGLQKPKPPAADLLDKDPLAYMKQRQKYDAAVAEYNGKVSALQQQRQQHEARERQRLAEYRAEQEQALLAAIPELADPQKADAVKRDLVKAGTQYGFAEHEVAGINDARQVQVLNDARKWRELQAREAQARQKAQKARPVVKPGVKQPDSNRSKLIAQRNRLKQTGSVEDALALMLAPTERN